MKITSEIFQVGGNGITGMEDGSVYLVNFDGHAALVDAGCGKSVSMIMDNIKACGVEPGWIEYLLITHCHFDHCGGGKELKDILNCKTVAHELDAKYIEGETPNFEKSEKIDSQIEPQNISEVEEIKGDEFHT